MGRTHLIGFCKVKWDNACKVPGTGLAYIAGALTFARSSCGQDSPCCRPRAQRQCMSPKWVICSKREHGSRPPKSIFVPIRTTSWKTENGPQAISVHRWLLLSLFVTANQTLTWLGSWLLKNMKKIHNFQGRRNALCRASAKITVWVGKHQQVPAS